MFMSETVYIKCLRNGLAQLTELHYRFDRHVVAAVLCTSRYICPTDSLLATKHLMAFQCYIATSTY